MDVNEQPDPTTAVWYRVQEELQRLLDRQVLVETQASVEAMMRALAKRTASNIPRNVAERDALINLFQEVCIALGWFRKAGV